MARTHFGILAGAGVLVVAIFGIGLALILSNSNQSPTLAPLARPTPTPVFEQLQSFLPVSDLTESFNHALSLAASYDPRVEVTSVSYRHSSVIVISLDVAIQIPESFTVDQHFKVLGVIVAYLTLLIQNGYIFQPGLTELDLITYDQSPNNRKITYIVQWRNMENWADGTITSDEFIARMKIQ